MGKTTICRISYLMLLVSETKQRAALR